MADIDVVKKSSRVWLWVVIALVVALALWFLLGRETTSAVGGQIDNGGRPHAAAPQLVGPLAAGAVPIRTERT